MEIVIAFVVLLVLGYFAGIVIGKIVAELLQLLIPGAFLLFIVFVVMAIFNGGNSEVESKEETTKTERTVSRNYSNLGDVCNRMQHAPAWREYCAKRNKERIEKQNAKKNDLVCSDACIKEFNKKINSQDFSKAKMVLNPYGNLTNKQKQEFEKSVLAIVKPIPLSNYDTNYEGYLLLAWLNENNEKYKEKIFFYKKKITNREKETQRRIKKEKKERILKGSWELWAISSDFINSGERRRKLFSYDGYNQCMSELAYHLVHNIYSSGKCVSSIDKNIYTHPNVSGWSHKKWNDCCYGWKWKTDNII